jgi:hypothetical protein
MKEISLIDMKDYGSTFIPSEYIAAGDDAYTLRNFQNRKPEGYWRKLTQDEIGKLTENDNTSDDWNNVLVHDPFAPALIRRSSFYGLVRIGKVETVALGHHDLRIPGGITDSFIVSCDIGDNCAIRNVRYAAHYVIGDFCMLLNIDELHVTNHAKFGNGIVKHGENESSRLLLALANEAGGREVAAFDGMIPADAYIWHKFREDALLQSRFLEITDNAFDKRRGYYGIVGNCSVIKNCGVIKDVLVGNHCYINGAHKLENLTINSSDEEPTDIGEGVELTDGIVGHACRVFYGCKAVRFVLGRNSTLGYGARLIHTFLGDNSTVSCCEILHNLIFPAHEQHHNNSFLISSCVLGQSNIAAGATIGSNHNSRANDGEIIAGRGFWPGLSVTLKHSCRFASFVLLSKGDYPAEMNIPLPFSLVLDERSRDELHIMPAYFWMYNMYALERNSWKFTERDKRRIKAQNIEFAALAPDTAEEIFNAMKLISVWIAQADLRNKKKNADTHSVMELESAGKKILSVTKKSPGNIEVLAADIENSNRSVIILKAFEAYHAYRDMLFYYSIITIIGYMLSHEESDLKAMIRALAGERETAWVNLGGQLVREKDCEELLAGIKSGKYDSWDAIHSAYGKLHGEYELAKQKHAFATLVSLLEKEELTATTWCNCLDRALSLQEFVCEQVYVTRKKDFENPFRKSTFRNDEEMKAVVGTAEENSFVKYVQLETEKFRRMIEEVKTRG